MPAPDLADVMAYLGDTSWEEPQIQAALDAELSAQAAVCRVPRPSLLYPATYPEVYADAIWPADLTEAALRRVARNLALRALPLGLQTSMSEAAVATVRVGTDPEIRRLEAPFRKVLVA